MHVRLEVEGNEEELELVLRAKDLCFALKEIMSILENFRKQEPFLSQISEIEDLSQKVLKQLEVSHLILVDD